jgi:hypothetical protein
VFNGNLKKIVAAKVRSFFAATGVALAIDELR